MTNHEALWQRVCSLVEQITGVTVGELPMPMLFFCDQQIATLFCPRVPFYHAGGNRIVCVDEPDRRQLAHEMAHAVIHLAGIALEDWQEELIPQVVDEAV